MDQDTQNLRTSGEMSTRGKCAGRFWETACICIWMGRQEWELEDAGYSAHL